MLSYQSQSILWFNKMKDGLRIRKTKRDTARGKRLSAVDVGSLGSPQLSSSPKTPNFTQPAPAPHATAPTFPEIPAEAVTVGPSVGNFLWSAGNNLTWGLDST